MSIGIVLMSRAPLPGKTKTRLQTHLTGEEAASLHRAFLQDMGTMLLQLTRQIQEIKLYLAYTPEGSRADFEGLIPADFKYFPQKGADLGKKMHYCLNYVSKENDKQIIMGSDLPSLRPDIITTAIKELDTKDIVIGPSCDGGYYLLGTKRPHSFLFSDMTWGQGDVFKNTINAIAVHDNLSYGLVDSCSDIDTFPELTALKRRLENKNSWQYYPEHTADIINSIIDENFKQGVI